MMTVDSLSRQFHSDWQSMTPRQQAAFRGNVTWLMGRTTSAFDLQRLDALRRSAQPRSSTPRTAESAVSAKRYSIYATRLKLERKAITLSECPAIGQHVGLPSTAANIARELIGSEAQEHLLVLLLDVRNQVSGVQTVHIGTTSACVIKVADILRVALLGNASAIILVHNHPSGEPTPSPEDIRATRDVVAAAQLMDITVLDHLVITDQPGKFTSLAERHPDIFKRGYSWK